MDRTLAQQIEQKTKNLRPHLEVPSGGWIKTIRRAYQMSAMQLGAKLGVSHVSIIKAENAEVALNITLGTLAKIANALNCDLQYALIPRTPIHTYVQHSAEKKAMDMTRMMAEKMVLADQDVSQQELGRMFKKFLGGLQEKPKKLWEE